MNIVFFIIIIWYMVYNTFNTLSQSCSKTIGHLRCTSSNISFNVHNYAVTMFMNANIIYVSS